MLPSNTATTFDALRKQEMKRLKQELPARKSYDPGLQRDTLVAAQKSSRPGWMRSAYGYGASFDTLPACIKPIPYTKN